MCGEVPGVALEARGPAQLEAADRRIDEVRLLAIAEAVLGKDSDDYAHIIEHCAGRELPTRQYCVERGLAKSTYYERLDDIAGMLAVFLNARAVLREIDAGGTPREILRRIQADTR